MDRILGSSSVCLFIQPLFTPHPTSSILNEYNYHIFERVTSHLLSCVREEVKLTG